jgi:hypothetical protein
MFNVKWAIFQPYYGKNKLNFNEMMMFPMYWTNTKLDVYSVAHWSISLQADMLFHSDISSWFWANQSLLLLPNSAYLAEKQQIPI